MTMVISRPAARRIILGAQGLDGGWSLSPGSDGAAEVIDRLGYVQIDTIAVIERAHHHVLWTRSRDYAPAMLDDLLSRDRRVFEFWTHAAAYIPMMDYRFYLPKMRAFGRRPKVRSWVGENRKVVRHVLERVRAEGPLRSADFANPREKRGEWWDWTPAKQALEILYRKGELMITGRRHFQRIYDLTERVLPPEVDATVPSAREVARYVVRRTLAAQGVVSEKDAAWWLKDRKSVSTVLREMCEAGHALEVRLAGGGDAPYFVPATALRPDLERSPEAATVRLLSPFDNLVTDRARALTFFDFDYRIECYTPEAKRKYGYFSLPILWGDRLVGRLDPKADRKAGRFIVKSLALEPGFSQDAELGAGLGRALRAFAEFHGCPEIVLERSEVTDSPIAAAISTA